MALLFAAGVAGCAPGQRFASLGELNLESGLTIRECRVGYRTFGRLDERRSNAVLFTPWTMGTSGDLARKIGPGRLVDSSRYFVIAVDALGNGVSSSPSNSREQPGRAFPTFSMRDLVESQYRLVTRELGLDRLKAVVGISLGGMQAFQWATAHPGFAEKVVAIAATPRPSAQERGRWRVSADEVLEQAAWRRALQDLRAGEAVSALRQLQVQADDYARQARTIASFDLTSSYGGSMARTATAIRGHMLVVVSRRDPVVEPSAARELARLARAEVVELDGRCGHDAPSCEGETVRAAVSRFLDQ